MNTTKTMVEKMRNRHFVILGLAVTLLAGACASSKGKPDAEKAAEKPAAEGIPELQPLEFRDRAPSAEKIGEKEGVSAYDIGGLTLLHKPTPANQVVSARVYIDGGVTNLTDETAGIEELAFRTAVNGGTASTPKDKYTSALDSMGSSVSAFTGRDYSGYSLRSIVKHFDKSWGLFTEAILEPKMPEDELAVQREKQLAEIEQLAENPNRLVSLISRRLIAGSHPYRHLQLGTRENVKDFERKDLLAYQRSLLNPKRMLVVVVGDIPSKKVVRKVRESVGKLKASEWERPELPAFDVSKLALEGAQKKIPTNYILGLFPAPAPDEKDYMATKLALSYLSDRLFEEVRTKRNLSYAVSSGISSRRTNTGYLYVSAKAPPETLQVIFDEVKRLKQDKLTKKELQRTRNVFITEHYMGLETNSNLASSLASAQLLQGDWRRHATFIDEVKAVTPADVKKAAKTYMKDYQFGIVGQPDSLPKSALEKMTGGDDGGGDDASDSETSSK